MESTVAKAKNLELGRRYLVVRKVWGAHVPNNVLDAAKSELTSGHPGVAKDLLDQQPSTDSDPEALNTRAVANMYLGENAGSDENYDMANRLLLRQQAIVVSGRAGNRIEWAMKSGDRGMLDDAIHFAREAMTLDPTWHYSYINLGAAYVLKGELESAVKVLEQELRGRWPEGRDHPDLREAVLGNDGYWSPLRANPELRERIRLALD